MNKYYGLLLVPTWAFCAQTALTLKPTSVFVPSRLGNVVVSHRNDAFVVSQNGIKHEVQRHNMDAGLRQISNIKHLKAFLKNGYVSVNQNSNGDFTLASNYRLKGGGPFAAGIAYWITKTLCYGTAVAAAGTALTVTAGSAAPAIAGGVAYATAGATAATSVTGAVIGASSLAGVATTATVATITSAGSIAAAAAAVETASTGVAAFFLALPIP